ncbi:hypothetical protein N7532_010327 [Penicillium argentinense]|uniref:DUF647 domain-containing protein n=1 Tax=Penicillium argentinense TaxID=1131581 RepID=A0A9W9EPN7_9EURO|nr:uncharacterized protein N7532_010327 [Penicillium argentinense]KAJ5085556.1 hypothetical protein N7532_010327 [Penicillium argentinense]
MAPPRSRLILHETDEAETQTAVFVYTENATKNGASRVDISPDSKHPPSWTTNSLIATLGEVFLPAGYPNSVTDDYLPYQIYDSLQAFCSSIAGLLASRAVLQGVGVGNAEASPTSALLLHILQETSGRIATILFAHRVGTIIEPECKTYRFAADIFNDLGMFLECLSPMVPAGSIRVSVLSTAGILKALCGVAGGSSKASLSAHFAKWGSLAELNAKDSSQETVISLLGMLAGSLIVPRITGFKATWGALIMLLFSHLTLNYLAVRSVHMTSLNRQRASIVFSSLLENDIEPSAETETVPKKINHSKHLHFPTPAETAHKERILFKGTPFFWNAPATYTSSTLTTREDLGSAEIGVSLSTFFSHASMRKVSGSFETNFPLNRLEAMFKNEHYLLYLFSDSDQNTSQAHASILLKQNAKPRDQLKAWCHALLVAHAIYQSSKNKTKSKDLLDVKEAEYSPGNLRDQTVVLNFISAALERLNDKNRFKGYLAGLEGVGWDVDASGLEVKGGKRVVFKVDEA